MFSVEAHSCVDMENGDQDVDVGTWFSNLLHDQWVTVPVAGRRPPGRYKHAAAVAGQRLFISGGSRNGRHLSDIQVLDFTNTTWLSLKLPAAPAAAKSENDSLVQVFPATSGHHMIVWGQKLLLLDGHSKYSSCVTVRFLDLEKQQCGVMETIGEIPVAREGESVTLVGSKLIVFGGEDIHRKLLNDIYILDLDTMTWNKVEATQNPPSPRYDHAAAVHAERYLLVFGGCSHSTCFNDLYVLDLETMEWSQPETRGDYVSPRAGHSGITVHGNWYIVGGGDNKNGALNTLVLDMTKLVWSVVTTVKPRDPLASEGISICLAHIHGDQYLVAFGGYNGNYNNEVLVMRPKLNDSARPKMYLSPAAAAAAASVAAAYSIGSGKQLDSTKTENTEVEGAGQKQDGFSGTTSVKDAKRLLELSLAEVREENSKLKGKMDEINSNHEELSKELASVQGQLISERSRCFKLEAQTAELQGMLESLPSVEAEVQSLRKEKFFTEQVEHNTSVQRQGSRGVWQWFSGGESSP
ncbi:acyl-CoA-binding domain-containing protein 4-like isoform X2 [Chenopodium quinoa]|uniref:acyl-CoA-binding domain-containing protein 4-like isoform X2 n=1 Tax=Chenopodium quinoa TaxID=63459 RepID=UPI000B789CE1|nr:acyl-CoA-binding domain-containing protein 4-like isoform X2 [Chenopodium quinoa]